MCRKSSVQLGRYLCWVSEPCCCLTEQVHSQIHCPAHSSLHVAVPDALTAIERHPIYLVVAWTAPPSPFNGSYLLTYGRVDGTASYIMHVVVVGSTSYNITGLQPSTNYMVTVQASNAPVVEFGPPVSELLTTWRGCPKLPDQPCGNVGNVTWPEAEIGQEASVPCPCGASGQLTQQLRATRMCGGTFRTGGVWEEQQCDSCHFSSLRLALCELTEVGVLHES